MLKEEPSVYVILVNYKGLQDTIECIESVKKANYKKYKIIVVDNASKDKSAEELRQRYNDLRIVELEENIGFAGGNNVGINIAINEKADYVLLLNNDTIVDKNFIRELVNTAQVDNNIGVVGGKIYYFDDKKLIWFAGAKIDKFTGKTEHIGVDKIDIGQYDTTTEADYITGCMMLVPIEVIKEVGMMDESYFLYYEETDWCIRIKKAGYKLIYEPKSIIYHKVSSSTKKINYIMSYYYDRNSYYFITKNYGTLNKIFMYFYKRIFLALKYVKCIIDKNTEKKLMVIKAYDSISKKEMGKYNG